tara:strand:- start:239 stop:550 length:312 start_codon:yes stop_codon:yes gene_type:complete
MDRMSSAGLGPRGGSGERHGGTYNEIDEIEFLNDMPRLMANRAGGKKNPRKQSDVQVLGQYRQYLNASMYRKEWGEINKKKVLEHCRKLMLRYARRAHKTAYQ